MPDIPTTSSVSVNIDAGGPGGKRSATIGHHQNAPAASSSATTSLSALFRSAADLNAVAADGGVVGSSPQTSTPTMIRKTPQDFVFLKMIGEGSFSTVYRCKEVTTDRIFAIKVCEKRTILKEKKTAYVLREKDVMAKVSKNPHPFFVSIYCTFQDTDRLYFVMTLAPNGELLDYMKKLGSFDEDVSRFFTAEIICALEHLHKLGVVHRDLKPENILLSEDMHIIVSDFGSSKIITPDEDRPTPLLPRAASTTKRSSFVGTAQYVSPEVLNGKAVTPSCDFWAVGCILYQMLSGLPPFRAQNEYLIFQKIIKSEYTFPDGFPEIPMSLVSQLLIVDANQRLGDEKCGGVDKLKQHPFFKGIHWDTLAQDKPPDMLPFLPGTRGSVSFHSRYKMLNGIEPGLDDKQMTRLLGLQWEDVKKTPKPLHLMDTTPEEREKRLVVQRRENPYHEFVENHLILKMGILDKRKGLFSRRRMFLLTDGPGLYYVDPVNKIYKGKVPWSKEVQTEGLSFRLFFVHTPLRTYSLEDPENRSFEWCEAIEQVLQYYFSSSQK